MLASIHECINIRDNNIIIVIGAVDHCMYS